MFLLSMNKDNKIVTIGVSFVIVSLFLGAFIWGLLEKPCAMLAHLDAYDKNLVNCIRNRHIFPPTGKKNNLIEEKKNLKSRIYNNMQKTAARTFMRKVLSVLFRDEPRGTFLEVGANDGELLSDSLYLETSLGWTGLLVEPNPMAFASLSKRRRRSFISDLCMGVRTYSYMGTLEWSRDEEKTGVSAISYRKGGLVNTFDPMSEKEVAESYHLVTCTPLVSLLLAFGKPKIHLVIIDINSFEEEVLANFPLGSYEIDAWIIKHMNTNDLYLPKTFDFPFIERFTAKGYQLFAVGYHEMAYVMVNESSSLFRNAEGKRPLEWVKLVETFS